MNSELPRRMRYLQRIMAIMRVIDGHPVSTLPEIHRALTRLGFPHCQRTVRRDLKHLAMAGWIEGRFIDIEGQPKVVYETADDLQEVAIPS